MTTTRRQAREWAIQMLTAADLNPPGDGVRDFMASCWEELALLDENEGKAVGIPAKFRDFVEERVSGVLSKLGELDALIDPLLQNWDFSRLGTVERSVLRMGAWEMKYSDVPKPVVINEAVDLANWFSSPKSRPLVNGVLDRLAKTL